MSTHHPVRGMRKQRGLVAVIVTVALFAFLAVAALAIDINHALMNRTKLQSGVDAAALAAALILSESGTESEAKDAAISTLAKLASSTGNSELNFADTSSTEVCITFSNNPTAFPQPTEEEPGCPSSSSNINQDRYVRVDVSNLSLASFFMQIMGIDKQLSASAVAGKLYGGGTCNVVPMAICAEDQTDTDTGGFHINGELNEKENEYYDGIYDLKLTTNDSEMGSGNFQLIDLDADEMSESKKDEHIRNQLAGAFTGCIMNGEPVVTKTGNTIGPVRQGLNTRFDGDQVTIPGGGPDIYIQDPNWVDDPNDEEDSATVLAFGDSDSRVDITFADYKSDELGNGRRLMLVPIIDCTQPSKPNDESEETTENSNSGGRLEFPLVTLGCFMLVNPIENGNADKAPVVGEFVEIENCPSPSTVRTATGNSDGPYIIVLYDDPYNKES